MELKDLKSPKQSKSLFRKVEVLFEDGSIKTGDIIRYDAISPFAMTICLDRSGKQISGQDVRFRYIKD